MKIKTSELTGAALNWAVAKCEGVSFVHGDCEYELDGRVFQRGGCSVERRYSTDWSQGGPIIERKGIGLLKVRNRLPHQQWDAGEEGETETEFWGIVCGPTPLIAAMRCHVIDELGDEVDIPEELK
jgi:hypothetical protein